MQKPTKKELSQFHFLKREIEFEQRHLKELETSFDSRRIEITGMPKYNGTVDSVGNYVTEIDALKHRVACNIERCTHELFKLYEYIDSVEDSQMRLILKLRYIDRLSWKQVAANIGGGNTADCVRLMVDRFIKNN